MQKPAYLYVVAFVGGGAVLALEILGTRVLGPFYGVSLFLWSALISVTLAALSTGYAIGGRWADKNPAIQRLSFLLAGAGLWTLAIPWLRYPVLALGEVFGLRGAVLFAAFILFFPPLALLGMVSPFVVKLRATSMNEVGTSTGNLYAISTIGSVLAALLTGFILIPNIGVNRLLLSISSVLFLTAAVGFLISGKKPPVAGLALLIVLAVFGAAVTDDFRHEEGLVGVYQSPYAEIRVVDTDAGRHMLIDGGVHTLMDPRTGKSRHPYVAVMEIPQYLIQQPGDMLLVGLGGGSLVKSYTRAGWSVDAVEIDQRVVDLAYTHFGLDTSEASVFVMDGRQFLAARDKSYNLILIDAFGSSSIPFHLITRGAFNLVASRLSPGGMVGINVESVGWNHKIVMSLSATLREYFAHVVVLPMAEPPNTVGNIVILASNDELVLYRDFPRDYADPFYRFGEQYHRNHAWDNQFVPSAMGAQIITDDLNPVDLWSEEVNFVARQNLHKYFGETGLGW